MKLSKWQLLNRLSLLEALPMIRRFAAPLHYVGCGWGVCGLEEAGLQLPPGGLRG